MKIFVKNLKVIEMIRPPYSSEFITLFLPLVEEFKSDEEKSLQEFLQYVAQCKDNSI